jgi:hypothetical protein
MTTAQIVVGIFGLALVVLLGGSVLVSSLIASTQGMQSSQDVKRDAVRARVAMVRPRERTDDSRQIASSAGKIGPNPTTVRSRMGTTSRPVRRTIKSTQVFAASGSTRRISLASLSRRGDDRE